VKVPERDPCSGDGKTVTDVEALQPFGGKKPAPAAFAASGGSGSSNARTGR
jgi:hypothetical protein